VVTEFGTVAYWKYVRIEGKYIFMRLYTAYVCICFYALQLLTAVLFLSKFKHCQVTKCPGLERIVCGPENFWNFAGVTEWEPWKCCGAWNVRSRWNAIFFTKRFVILTDKSSASFLCCLKNLSFVIVIFRISVLAYFQLVCVNIIIHIWRLKYACLWKL